MDNADFLQMQGISKSYDGTRALREVDFSASAGEVIPSSGKQAAKPRSSRFWPGQCVPMRVNPVRWLTPT
jgi:ABC-type phosphonate transport system ATPase subunit